MDRKPQLTRRGCQFWKLQGQPFFFRYDMVLPVSYEDFQHALNRFSAAFDHAGMEIGTENPGAVSLQKPKAVYAASK